MPLNDGAKRTAAKREAMIEVAYDLVSKIHSDVCNMQCDRGKTNQIVDNTMELLRRLMLLSKQLEGFDDGTEKS